MPVCFWDKSKMEDLLPSSAILWRIENLNGFAYSLGHRDYGIKGESPKFQVRGKIASSISILKRSFGYIFNNMRSQSFHM
jgi:hypothetical protein